MARSTTGSLAGRCCVLMLLALIGTIARAGGDLRLEQPWIRLLPGDLPLAGYFELVNAGAAPASLVSVESPAFGAIMLHRSVSEGDSSHMVHVHAVEVPAGGSIRFEPGGYHLMLMRRRHTVEVGDRIPMTLLFEDGRRVTAEFEVRPPGAN